MGGPGAGVDGEAEPDPIVKHVREHPGRVGGGDRVPASDVRDLGGHVDTFGRREQDGAAGERLAGAEALREPELSYPVPRSPRPPGASGACAALNAATQRPILLNLS